MRVVVCFAILAALVVLWLAFGEHLSFLADHWLIYPEIESSVLSFSAQASELTIGSRRWPLPHPTILDSRGRVTVYADGLAFTFGPVEHRFGETLAFLPSANDSVTFIRTAGRIPWPTPLHGIFTLGASQPKWSRHVYDTLRWKKATGATLEITWRDEQRARPGGWSDEYNNQVDLFRIRQSPMEDTAAAYLARTKQWNHYDFRLELEPPEPKFQQIAAIYLKDKDAEHPGSGKSVRLTLDQNSNQVVGETGWQ